MWRLFTKPASARPCTAGSSVTRSGNLRQPLDAETLAQLKQAIGRWRVLFFRDQAITGEQQLAFGRAFGPLTPAHPISEGLEAHPEIWERAAAEYTQREKDKESEAILSLLNEEVTRPEYQVRFHWSPNALVLWDNQAVAHAGPIDYKQFDLPRVVRRITVAGELPRGTDGFVPRPLEGDLFSVIG
jgi:alpha-ketoglutarate-dependent taurine dioxygenase